MDRTEHNAPGFHYLVKWRRADVAGADWETHEAASDVASHTVPGTPIYKPYQVHVLALNEVGEAVLKQKVHILYSSEDGKFCMLYDTSQTRSNQDSGILFPSDSKDIPF